MKTASAVALLALLFAPLVAPAHSVYACSIGNFGSPDRQRDELLRSLAGADLVLAGTVTDERPIGTLGSNDAYESTITPEAVLTGDAPEGPLVVGQLDFDFSTCSGGPRLLEGERALLALDRGFIESDGGTENESIWRLHHFLGKVRLDEDEAVSQYATAATSLGPPGQLIRDYGAALGSADAQIDAAIAAATSALPPAAPDIATPEAAQTTDSGGSATGLIVLGFIVVAVLVAGVIARSRRARPH
jgi:hypothetical protein